MPIRFKLRTTFKFISRLFSCCSKRIAQYKLAMPPKVTRARRKRTTSSSADHSALFSGEEAETLVTSSRIFTEDFADSCSKNTRGRKAVTELSLSHSAVRGELPSPAKVQDFQRLKKCWKVRGKVRESIAVVKRSLHPLQEFKCSMLEMIMEKEIFEQDDLQELLRCFLSLNSPHHHRLIFKAFFEISQLLRNEGISATVM